MPTTAWSAITAPASAVTSTVTSAATSVASFIRDTFSDVSNIGLLEHVGELGAAWTRHPTASGSSVRIAQATKSTYPLASSWFVASGVPPTTDYDVVATLKQFSTAPQTAADLVARSSSTNVDTRYGARYATTDNNWQMYRVLGGVATVLDTLLAPLVTGSAYTMRFRLSGASLTFYVNDVLTLSSVDTLLTLPGVVGIAQGNIGAMSATSGLQLQNFGVENTVASVATSIVTTPTPIPSWTATGAAVANWAGGSQVSTPWAALP